MKIIFLNIWGGRLKKPLMDFIKKYQDTDIFCLQEVYYQAQDKEKHPAFLATDSLDIYNDIQKALPKHQGFYRPVIGGFYGQAIFAKKNLEIIQEGDLWIYTNDDPNHERGKHSRNMQWLEFKYDGQIYSVLNVHGLWNGQGKTDTADRLKQSENIKQFIDNIKGPKILGGDFNLLPDTQSLTMLEKDMINLVKKYKVESTRTSHYEKPGKFADYILLSPDIKEKDFQVLPEEVSDHAALYLEF